MARVAMGTDEKRRPGLFETIIRRSIPLAVARCVSFSFSLSLSLYLFVLLFFPSPGEVANRLRG